MAGVQHSPYERYTWLSNLHRRDGETLSPEERATKENSPRPPRNLLDSTDTEGISANPAMQIREETLQFFANIYLINNIDKADSGLDLRGRLVAAACPQ